LKKLRNGKKVEGSINMSSHRELWGHMSWEDGLAIYGGCISLLFITTMTYLRLDTYIKKKGLCGLQFWRLKNPNSASPALVTAPLALSPHGGQLHKHPLRDPLSTTVAKVHVGERCHTFRQESRM
jgi:hypothetical protein